MFLFWSRVTSSAWEKLDGQKVSIGSTILSLHWKREPTQISNRTLKKNFQNFVEHF